MGLLNTTRSSRQAKAQAENRPLGSPMGGKVSSYSCKKPASTTGSNGKTRHWWKHVI